MVEITNSEIIVSVIGAFILGVVLYRIICSVAERVFNKRMKHEYPGKAFVSQNKTIYNDLVELRALINSDRAYVIQFHNGHEFLLSNPVWKLTCTHEVVRTGVTYEADNIQGVLASRVSELVDSTLSGEFLTKGVHGVSLCGKCQSKEECVKDKKVISVIQVQEMQIGFCRFYLEEQNVKTIVQCGMGNKDGAFGLVGADFTGVSVTDPNTINKVAEQICLVSEKIRHSLQSNLPNEKTKWRNFFHLP